MYYVCGGQQSNRTYIRATCTVVVVFVVVVYICKCDGGGCSYGVGLPIAMWCLPFHPLAQIPYSYLQSSNLHCVVVFFGGRGGCVLMWQWYKCTIHYVLSYGIYISICAAYCTRPKAQLKIPSNWKSLKSTITTQAYWARIRQSLHCLPELYYIIYIGQIGIADICWWRWCKQVMAREQV